MSSKVINIDEMLKKSLAERGICSISSHWITQAIDFVKIKRRDIDTTNILCLSEAIYKLFLHSDYHEIYDQDSCNLIDSENNISFISSGYNNDSYGKHYICKPTIFQIDEVINVGASHEQKKSSSCPRLLKFYLTTGNLKFVGIELNHIPSLKPNIPPGTKILVYMAQVRHGSTILFTSSNVKVLGGDVERLSLLAQTTPTHLVSATHPAVAPHSNHQIPPLPSENNDIIVNLTTNPRDGHHASNRNVKSIDEASQQIYQNAVISSGANNLTPSRQVSPLKDSIKEAQRSNEVIDITSPDAMNVQHNNFVDETFVDDHQCNNNNNNNNESSKSLDRQQQPEALVHHFAYFKFPETQSSSACVPIEASCNKITKFKVTNNTYCVWLVMDDGYEEEIVSVNSNLVTKFIGITPSEYEQHMLTKSKSEQNVYRDDVAGRFRNFIGVFMTKRIASTIGRKAADKGPIIEFLQYAEES